MGGQVDGGSSDGQVTDSVSDSLLLWLDVPEEVAIGEPVRIRLRVENVSGRELDLHLRGRDIVFDLMVSETDGETVWRRLHEAVIPAILRLETLAPEEMLELSDTWNQLTNEGDPVQPGAYTVKGEVLTEGEPLETPAYRLRVGREAEG